MLDTSEGKAWIIKPASSACGRGIYITNKFADMPVGAGLEGNWIAQRYIEDPLLLDGLKFDLRLYVAVTSFRPLRVYLHQEGLCRLATEAYSPDSKTFGNRFIHLTNYSINRKSSRYEPATTGEASDDERCDLRQPTASSSNNSPERCGTNADRAFSIPHCGPSGSTAGGTSETASELAARTAAKGRAAPNTSNAATASRNTDDSVMDNEQEHGKAEKPATHIGKTEPTNAKGDADKADGGGSSSRSHSWGVRGGKGSKWSLKALRRSLAEMGVDVPALWEDINSVVIKTLIAIEAQV
ncbi:unnamed protein product, partial [Hapterophycus canaliculatus]